MLRRPVRTSMTVSLAVAMATSVALLAPAGVAQADTVAFDDTIGSPAQEAIEALVAQGVVNGCGDGAFCPLAPLTRAQMATVLANALQLPTGGAVLADDGDGGLEDGGDAALVEAHVFADIEGNHHESSIAAIVAAGIARGCDEGMFCPEDTITRGQMATMVAEAFALPATDMSFFDDGGTTHGVAIDRLAAAGIAAGCGQPLTAFCPDEPVLRAQAAMFLARAMSLVEPVHLTPLEERRALQAEIDAEAAEAEAKAQAEAEAAAARLKIWDDLAQCESGGNWSINTGNGYYGGLQFHIDTWRKVGGTGYPHQASKAEQIHRGEILQQRLGWGQWPTCARRLGLI